MQPSSALDPCSSPAAGVAKRTVTLACVSSSFALMTRSTSGRLAKMLVSSPRASGVYASIPFTICKEQAVWFRSCIGVAAMEAHNNTINPCMLNSEGTLSGWLQQHGSDKTRKMLQKQCTSLHSVRMLKLCAPAASIATLTPGMYRAASSQPCAARRAFPNIGANSTTHALRLCFAHDVFRSSSSRICNAAHERYEGVRLQLHVSRCMARFAHGASRQHRARFRWLAYLHGDAVHLDILWDNAACPSVFGVLAAVHVHLVGGTLSDLLIPLENDNLQHTRCGLGDSCKAQHGHAPRIMQN